MWPTRALLNDDEERAAALGEALLREPEVDVRGAAAASSSPPPLLIVAASPAAAALVGHCLCASSAPGPHAELAGRVSLPTLPTPRVPTGEAGAAGGGRRKPSGAQDDDDDEGGAAAATATTATDADRDQDPSTLPVPDYCRGSDCPVLSFQGSIVVVAVPAPAGSAAAAAISGSTTTTTSLVPDARAGAWARGVLAKLQPSRVIVVAETPGEQYRGEGDPSEGLLAFTVWTSKAAAEAAQATSSASSGNSGVPPTLPAGTVVGGLPAALLAECEYSGVPAVAVVAVEMAPALAATHAPALGRAVAAVARAIGGSGGKDGSSSAESAVAARLESAPMLHAARYDMERALPAGGVYT